MKKIMRIISLLICMAMLMSSLSLSAIAEEIINAPITGDTSENVPNDITDSVPEPTEWQDNADDALDSSDESPDDIIGEYSVPFVLDDVTYTDNVIASGECGEEGDNVTWQLTYDGVLTISGSGAIADWWVGFPWEVENQTTSIVIEEGITRIGAGSLNLGNANSITMPNSLTSIGEYAFGGCYSLLSINIPAGVTIIENGDFKGCEILVDPENPAFCSVDGVLFSKDMSTIVAYPSGKEGNTYVIPNGVTVISDGAFSNCSQFTSITIPDGVTGIGNNAFLGCSIDSIYIPKSVEWIGWSVFENCINLSAIVVDKANPYYSSIDGVLFPSDMSELLAYPPAKADTSYIIPNGVKTIVNSAFSNCKNLIDITIPSSVTHIGWGAFGGCDSLNTLVIPKRVSQIDPWAFNNCPNLTDIYFKADSQVGEWSSEWNKNADGSNISAQIHWGYDDGTVDIIASGECGAEGDNVTWQLTDDGVLTISGNGSMVDDYQFENSWLIERIVIGEGVIGINANALNNCTNLASIEVDEANPAYCSVDDVLFNKDMTMICLYPNGKEDESYDIPIGVTIVGDFAFSGRDQLKSLTIPDGVKEIGRWAFSGCYGLSSIALPNTVEYIDGAAFACLLGISEIDLTEGCANYCTVDGVLFTADMSTLVAYPAGKSDAEYSVPAGVTEIGTGAFHYCVNLTSINISDGVSSIGYGAFQGCSSLRYIRIPASVQDIQWCVFTNCRSLESIVLPRNLGYIGGNQFIGCSSLTDIYCKSDEGQHDWDWSWNKDYEGNDIPAEIHWGYDDGTVEIVASGECGAEGDNVTWQLTSDGVLTISGSGAIDEWANFPWEVADQATAVVIEEGITGIGGNTLFYSFTNLTAIEVDENNPEYCSIDGVLFSKDESTIYCYPRNKEGESYDIPNGVTTIGGFAFADRPQLRSITIPEGVTEIGDYAFSGCTGLTSIVLPNTVEQIGNGAFAGLAGVEAIELAEGCANYRTVDGVLFTADMSVLLVYPAGKPDTEYNVPTGVTEICDGSFNGSKNLISVVISNGVSSIEYGAFANCSSLRNIEIPDSVQSINWLVFSDCTSLESIVLPRNLVWVGGRIFTGCSSLTDIYCKSDEGQYEWDWNWNKDYEGNDIPAVVHWGTHIHSYSEDWSSDEDNHWHECSCGEKADITTHVWDEGKVTKPATETAEGIMTYTCTVCMKTKDEVIPELIPITGSRVVVGNITGKPGETVDLTIVLAETPEINFIMIYDIMYDDSKVELISAEWLEKGPDDSDYDSSENAMYKDIGSNVADLNGTVARITLRIKENIDDCETSVSLQCVALNFDSRFDIDAVAGTVSIINVMRGDFNNDGKLSAADAIYLKKHIALPSRYPLNQNGDLDGDGTVTAKDALHLKRHIALPSRYPLH